MSRVIMGNVTTTGGSLLRNRADDGGGIFAELAGTMSLSGVAFSGRVPNPCVSVAGCPAVRGGLTERSGSWPRTQKRTGQTRSAFACAQPGQAAALCQAGQPVTFTQLVGVFPLIAT
ncbi:MAG: hypothetical protein KC432_16595, partial [Thermomicrobiales bacterium]|nr:hypothetical protein [Thermomicrobiales bacterium]